jgi:hypothetical protein
MKDFKFFKGTLDVMDDITRATASFNDDTPEGHMNRRRLYHTDINLYGRLRQSNNEMEQYFIERDLREQRDLNDNPIRLFQTTTTVSVNPTFWNGVKIFGTRVRLVLIESWRAEPVGVVFVSVLTTLITIIGIAKILSLW